MTDEVKVAAKSCGAVLFKWTDIALNAMLVMFSVAIIGFPLGYFSCLLITYTITSLLESGTGLVTKAINDMLGIK